MDYKNQCMLKNVHGTTLTPNKVIKKFFFKNILKLLKKNLKNLLINILINLIIKFNYKFNINNIQDNIASKPIIYFNIADPVSILVVILLA